MPNPWHKLPNGQLFRDPIPTECPVADHGRYQIRKHAAPCWIILNPQGDVLVEFTSYFGFHARRKAAVYFHRTWRSMRRIGFICWKTRLEKIG